MKAAVLRLDGVAAVTAQVDLDNPASIRVLEKCGMTVLGQTSEQATYHIRRPAPGR